VPCDRASALHIGSADTAIAAPMRIRRTLMPPLALASSL
jgi:hypothetical protein